MANGRFYLLSSALAVVSVGASPSSAQDSAGASSATMARPEDDERAPEIVVTANRRSQPLIDVGASVDTMDGEAFPARGIASTPDLQKAVIGFSAADTGVNVPAYSLRGIGLNDPSLASNPTVVVSVDDVPLPYAAMTQGALLDLHRVEIVKGPQGTLYGQNATGGAINYITSKPTDVLAMGGRISVGSFDTAAGEFYVSGPLVPSVEVRLAASRTSSGPWQRSLTRDDALGAVSRSAARLLISWQPVDQVEIDLNANGWIDRSDTQASQLVAFRAQVPANAPLVPDVFSAPLAPARAEAADWNPGQPYSRDDRFYQLSLKANLRVAERASITGITSYSNYDARAFNDRDGIVAADFEFTTYGRIESVYQELRLAGDAVGFAWSAGANYRKDSTDELQATDVSRSTNTFVAGLKLNRVDFFSDQEVETYSFFADGELRLTPHSSVVAGARYTRDTRAFAGSTCDTGDGETSALYTVLSSNFRARSGLPSLPAIAPGECVVLSTDTFTPGIVTDQLIEDNFAFRGEINLKPTDKVLLYASYSRGYKAGSFPTLSAVFSLGYGPAKQERVDAIELGARADLLAKKLRVSGALFQYDYFDKQFRGRILDPVIGNLSKLVNIPRSKISGFEASLAASPTEGLTLHASAAHTKTEVKRFTGVNLFGQTEDFAGQTLPYTPPWSINAGGRMAWAVGNDLEAFVGADIVYRTRTSGFIGRDRPVDIAAYGVLDVRAGVEAQDSGWQVWLWGNNVTDTYYWHTAMRNGDTINRYAARPASFGMSLGFSF